MKKKITAMAMVAALSLCIAVPVYADGDDITEPQLVQALSEDKTVIYDKNINVTTSGQEAYGLKVYVVPPRTADVTTKNISAKEDSALHVMSLGNGAQGKITVNGDLSSGGQYAAYLYSVENASVNVNVSGNITAEQSGIKIQPEQGGSVNLNVSKDVTSNAGYAIDLGYNTSIFKGNANVVIEGNVVSKGESGNDNGAVVIHGMYADSIDNVKVKGNVLSKQTGLYLCSQFGATSKAEVGGNLTTENGRPIELVIYDGNGKFDALVNGIVSGGDYRFVVKDDNNQRSNETVNINIAVWKMKLNADGHFGALTNGDSVTQSDYVEGLVNYIIKVDQPTVGNAIKVTKADGTALNTMFDNYQVAKEGDKILVKAADGYKLTAVYNGTGTDKTEIVADANGNYPITVPKGGGIYITAEATDSDTNDNNDDNGGNGSNTNTNKDAKAVELDETTLNKAVEDVNDAIAAMDASAGELQTVKVDMTNADGKTATVVPVQILETIKGKNVDVVFDMGEYSWTINGKDITADTLSAINLKVNLDSSNVPADKIKDLAGDKPTKQISLAYDGDFGFKARLSLNLGKEYAGQYGNLYFYDANGKLVFMNAGKIDADGNASLEFTHASDYLVVIGEEVKESIPTGDNSHINAYLATVVTASAVAVATVLVKRKKQTV